MSETYHADPDAVLEHKFDFAGLTNGADGALTDWLAAGETIAEFDITATGVSLGDGSTEVITAAGNVTPVVPAATDTNTSVTVWWYSPTDGATITCKIRTSAGRVDDRTLTFSVADK